MKWKWTTECETAFQQLKQHLVSTAVLVHYDTQLPIKLASHMMPHSSEYPIAYGSRTFSASELNYSQLEKEALAIIFGIKKFHKFLYGRPFTLVTDHKPLVTILGPRSSLPTLAAARLQHWVLLLSGYQYKIEFHSTTKHGNADGLSQLPIR